MHIRIPKFTDFVVEIFAGGFENMKLIDKIEIKFASLNPHPYIRIRTSQYTYAYGHPYLFIHL